MRARVGWGLEGLFVQEPNEGSVEVSVKGEHVAWLDGMTMAWHARGELAAESL